MQHVHMYTGSPGMPHLLLTSLVPRLHPAFLLSYVKTMTSWVEPGDAATPDSMSSTYLVGSVFAAPLYASFRTDPSPDDPSFSGIMAT